MTPSETPVTCYQQAVEAGREMAILRAEGDARARLFQMVWREYGSPHPFRSRALYLAACSAADKLIDARQTCFPICKNVEDAA